MTSPRVCAGPTSINSITRPPTSMSSRTSKVRVGNFIVMSANSNAPKKLRNNSPISPGAAFSAANISGGTSVISWAAAVEAMISAPATSSLP